MSFDLTKLEKIRRRGANTIARCPACAEIGNDRKGEHLFITDKGKFGCVLYPGAEGHQHRQRIFKLVGVKENTDKEFEVRKPCLSIGTNNLIIEKNILGHLGHIQSTHARIV